MRINPINKPLDISSSQKIIYNDQYKDH